MAYGVIEKTKVMAKDVDSLNRPATIASAVENGSVLNLTGYSVTAGEGEVWTGVAPTTSVLTNLWMVATPEVVTTAGKYRGLDPDIRNFVNASGDVLDVFKPQIGDIIKLTADAVGGTIGANTFAVATNGELKLQWGTAAVSGLSLKLIKTDSISLATGTIGSQKVTAYKFEVVAIA